MSRCTDLSLFIVHLLPVVTKDESIKKYIFIFYYTVLLFQYSNINNIFKNISNTSTPSFAEILFDNCYLQVTWYISRQKAVDQPCAAAGSVSCVLSAAVSRGQRREGRQRITHKTFLISRENTQLTQL